MKTGYKNVHLVTMDKEFTSYPEGFLLFEDDRITKLGAMQDFHEEEAECWYDGQGGILMPGMVNGHVHAGMIPFRSLGDDTKDRLRRFLFPLEQECVDRDFVEKSTAYAIAEMQLAGITTICDMYYFEDRVAEVVEKMGMRALLGETIIDQKTPDSFSARDALLYCETMLEKWHSSGRITPIVAPHAPNTNTGEVLEACRDLAKKYNTALSMHFAEMQYEMAFYREKYGMGAVEYLESLHLFEVPLVLAHGILLTEEDIERLSHHPKVSLVHCIGANTKAAKGVAPVQSLLQHHIPVGIGTDGPSSGNTLDLFTQMRMIANFQKTALKDRSAFPAREIVRMATMGGAEALGFSEEIGSLEVGKKADFTLIETDSVNLFPLHDVYSALVYSARAENVRDVWIDGEQVVRDKKLLRYTIKDLRCALQKTMHSFTLRAKELEKEIYTTASC